MKLPASTLSTQMLSEDKHSTADDIGSFGAEAALALSELPTAIAGMNRVYRHLISRRALSALPLLEDWIGHQTNVFLRHDAVFVFAIHHHPHVGMANFVELRDATFVVDEIGRNQTLRKTGTLPNQSTVHAFVSGQLLNIANQPPDIDLKNWHPVVYRPDQGCHFLATISPGELSEISPSEFRPVQSARRVFMIPGRIKVWCQEPQWLQSELKSDVHAEDTL
jgi:hypothetical protein